MGPLFERYSITTYEKEIAEGEVSAMTLASILDRATQFTARAACPQAAEKREPVASAGRLEPDRSALMHRLTPPPPRTGIPAS